MTADLSTLADVASAIQERSDFDSRLYAYAAGVEDVLRFLAGDVSGNVFRGFDEAMLPLTEAALR